MFRCYRLAGVRVLEAAECDVSELHPPRAGLAGVRVLEAGEMFQCYNLCEAGRVQGLW